jgi:hypothetical protein
MNRTHAPQVWWVRPLWWPSLMGLAAALVFCVFLSASAVPVADAAAPADATGAARGFLPPLQTITTTTTTVYLPVVMGPARPPAWLSSVNLNMWGWERALYATNPSDPAYPYPRLDTSQIGPPTLRTYEAVLLENPYVRVTVVPALGGRITAWQDKTTGRVLTYANPSIYPTHWGYRGWWLATGGVEWAFPVNEHGLNEYRPWQYEATEGTNYRQVRVWDVESRTGMTVEVTMRLYNDRSDLVITPRIYNGTDGDKPYQFWINAMLTLSDNNAPQPTLRFWIPSDYVTVHSSGWSSSGTPFPDHGMVAWLDIHGRNLSRYSDWMISPQYDWLGFFATPYNNQPQRGWAGVYDVGTNQGLVRIFPPDVAKGIKVFGMPGIMSSEYTRDNNSRYFEFWGGVNKTFWAEDDVVMPKGQSLTWEEHWYPTRNMAGMGWANADMAASVLVSGDNMRVDLNASTPLSARLVLRHNGTEVQTWDASAAPDAPFTAEYPIGTLGRAGWDVQIWQGNTLIATVPQGYYF